MRPNPVLSLTVTREDALCHTQLPGLPELISLMPLLATSTWLGEDQPKDSIQKSKQMRYTENAGLLDLAMSEAIDLESENCFIPLQLQLGWDAGQL